MTLIQPGIAIHKQIKKTLNGLSSSVSSLRSLFGGVGKRRLILMFGFLILFNGLVWLIIFFANKHYPLIFPLASLAFGLGLRHAVDADHIAAIDNTTRKLVHEGKEATAVGLFFSLGHSAVVIILSLLIVLFAKFLQTRIPVWQHYGSIIGALVSALFLLLIGFINLYYLRGTIQEWRDLKISQGASNTLSPAKGFITRLLMPFIKLVTKSWHMFFVGFLFGLGFDTATEVGLLGISATTAASGVPIGYVLLLPLAFACGMTIIDTLNGVLMLGAYGWANFTPSRKIYYNLYITGISIIIALLIGSLELLQVISKQFQLQGPFWGLVNTTVLTNLGYIIVAIFVASWLIAAGVYGAPRASPWYP